MEFSGENIEIVIASLILLTIFLGNILEVKRRTSNKSLLSIVLSPTILILFLPILLILFVIFTFYHKLITLFLKIKFGSKFGGLIKGVDSFHLMRELPHSAIHSLLLFKCTKRRSPEDFFNCIKQLAWKLHQHSKFKMIFLERFGYFYMLNGDLAVDDCIKKMQKIDSQKSTIEKEKLLALVNDYCNAPMPKNNTLPWEVLVGAQPVHWNEDGHEYYPVLFRIHHAIADGVTLMKLLTGLADKQDNHIKADQLNKGYLQIVMENFTNIPTNLSKLWKLLIRSCYVLFLFPASLVINFKFDEKYFNILHGPVLSWQRVLVWNVENDHEYFLKTKRIKNKIPGAKFSDVLMTAFSASLTEYFEKNSTEPPESIAISIPVCNESLNIPHLIPGKFNSEKVGNIFSFFIMITPIRENKLSLVGRLKAIKKESSILGSSNDYDVHSILMSSVTSVLPQPLRTFMNRKTNSTSIVSILPTLPNMTFCDGSMIIADIISWVPHYYDLGTGCFINTYDDRICVGFSVDKVLISNQDTIQNIADGVFKYLDLLADEVNVIYPDVV